MKKLIYILVLSAILISCNRSSKVTDYPITPVPFTQVTLNDNFWLPRLVTNNKITIPYAFEQSEETGRLKNFRIAGALEEGTFSSRYPFDDSDVFKIMEGAAYSLQEFYDPELDAFMDTLISWVAAAQEDDGYLYTYRTILGEKADTGWAGRSRWEKTHHHSHELYNIGHMYEAAVAHYNATGKRNFLDIALKSADRVYEDFGEGKIEHFPGHQEIEMGLVKLFRTTSDKRYLDLAKFFLDTRKDGSFYCQAHKPVTEQTEAVGHAVRAMYMYAGMADVAALTQDQAYIDAIDTIWKDVVNTKTYISGGIGAEGGHEGFGSDYDLPNETAYCETCAGIANILWNYRMFLLTGDGKYYDILEKTLYNNVLSGISLEGDKFFYPNPLESHGQHERSEWFACACCPSNICRFIPSVPGYVYAQTDETIYVNLYIASEAEIAIDDNIVKLTQLSDMPWGGNTQIIVNPEEPEFFEINIRIPGWAQGKPVPSDLYTFSYKLKDDLKVHVNNVNISDYRIKNAYVSLKRRWKKGDEIYIQFPFETMEVIASENIAADSGKIAIQRGPIVYAAEWIDNPGYSVLDAGLEDVSGLEVFMDDELLGGIVKLMGKAKTLNNGEIEEVDFVAIPYYSWAHRGAGEMAVWFEKVYPKVEGDQN